MVDSFVISTGQPCHRSTALILKAAPAPLQRGRGASPYMAAWAACSSRLAWRQSSCTRGTKRIIFVAGSGAVRHIPVPRARERERCAPAVGGWCACRAPQRFPQPRRRPQRRRAPSDTLYTGSTGGPQRRGSRRAKARPCGALAQLRCRLRKERHPAPPSAAAALARGNKRLPPRRGQKLWQGRAQAASHVRCAAALGAAEVQRCLMRC